MTAIAPVKVRRVSYPADVLNLPAASGAGKMWRCVLPLLSELVELRAVDLGGWPGRFRRKAPRPGVWLHDGHRGPIWVRQPVVAHLCEAAWTDPASAAHVAPKFARRIGALSQAGAQAAATVVTLSESSKRQIVDEYGIDADRVFVASLGVDTEVFHPGAGSPGDVLRRAAADPGRPYVLFVSQLHPRKNLQSLRAAMANLVRRGYPHQLVIVGGTATDRRWDPELFESSVADLPGNPGRVVHLKDVSEPEMAAVMAGASVFCLPSFMEGFGLTALEAMACGVPVVVSNRGALPEVVGDAGEVVEPDAEAIEAALLEVIDDAARAAQLSRAGVARAAEFTWQSTARAWHQAVEAAAAR